MIAEAKGRHCSLHGAQQVKTSRNMAARAHSRQGAHIKLSRAVKTMAGGRDRGGLAGISAGVTFQGCRGEGSIL